MIKTKLFKRLIIVIVSLVFLASLIFCLLQFNEIIQPYLATLKDFATIVSLIAASVIAILGLSTWRMQLTGTRKYELAKNILKATYNLRDTIDDLRIKNLTDEEIKIPINWDEQIEEVEKLVDPAIRNLESEKIEAEVLWGAPCVELINNLIADAKWFSFSFSIAFFITKYPNSKESQIFTPQKKEDFIKTISKKRGRNNIENESDFWKGFVEKINAIENTMKRHLI